MLQTWLKNTNKAVFLQKNYKKNLLLHLNGFLPPPLHEVQCRSPFEFLFAPSSAFYSQCKNFLSLKNSKGSCIKQLISNRSSGWVCSLMQQLPLLQIFTFSPTPVILTYIVPMQLRNHAIPWILYNAYNAMQYDEALHPANLDQTGQTKTKLKHGSGAATHCLKIFYFLQSNSIYAPLQEKNIIIVVSVFLW